MNFINRKKVKTRKPHYCTGCMDIIPSGSMVIRDTLVDGEIYSVYFCDICEKVLEEYGNDIEEFSEGDLRETTVYEYWYKKRRAEKSERPANTEQRHGAIKKAP